MHRSGSGGGDRAGAEIPSGFLECPACYAVFRYEDFSAPQFGLAAAASVSRAHVKLSEVRKARRELFGPHFERASPVATIIKRVRDLRTHKSKWDSDGAYRQTMANRGYIRDLLGVRTSPWSPTSASDVPESIKELDESTQRFVMIAAVLGDIKGQDAEWGEASAIAKHPSTTFLGMQATSPRTR